MRVCVCVCVRACVCVEHWTVRRSAAAVVSLSKELYSHCSSPPSCINGDLAIAGEVNAKLCMSHLMVEVQVGLQVPTPSSLGHTQPSYGVLVPSPGDLPCTDSEYLFTIGAQVSLGRHDRENSSYSLCFFVFVWV